MRKIVLLSDTHGSLDDRIFTHLKKADEIWHAGDIGSLDIINKLQEYASIKAVWGNIDNNRIRTEFEETVVFMCENVKVLIMHIGGYPEKYSKKGLALIQDIKPNLFISGHSHILKVIYDNKYQLLHMNPGAIGNSGCHKIKTILCFDIHKKEIKNLRIVEFPRKKI